jgi:hypothetical protein
MSWQRIRPQWRLWFSLGLLVLTLWLGAMPMAQASVHVYRERPGQVTVRSRLSLRDFSDRAWQVIAFKRTQGTTLQGYYLRLVGFPGAVEVDRQRPATVIAPTGQSRQLPWIVDPQAKTLPPNVGQFDLAPLLTELGAIPYRWKCSCRSWARLPPRWRSPPSSSKNGYRSSAATNHQRQWERPRENSPSISPTNCT